MTRLFSLLNPVFRWPIFRLVMVILVGLWFGGCSLLPDSPQATNPTRRVPTPRASVVAANSASTATTQRATRQPRRTPSATMTAAEPRTQPIAGFTAVTPDDLPPEARDTLALIEADGPFPYRQDGAVFQNRERLLPRQPRGYYREYTVETPGEDDRGARRIVAGENGELFYTEDHYDSFVQVIPQ